MRKCIFLWDLLHEGKQINIPVFCKRIGGNEKVILRTYITGARDVDIWIYYHQQRRKSQEYYLKKRSFFHIDDTLSKFK